MLEEKKIPILLTIGIISSARLTLFSIAIIEMWCWILIFLITI